MEHQHTIMFGPQFCEGDRVEPTVLTRTQRKKAQKIRHNKLEQEMFDYYNTAMLLDHYHQAMTIQQKNVAEIELP